MGVDVVCFEGAMVVRVVLDLFVLWFGFGQKGVGIGYVHVWVWRCVVWDRWVMFSGRCFFTRL